jgi:phosphopantetheinyl transferase
MENASLLHAPLTPGLRPACAERLLEALPYARRLRLERADPLLRASSLAGLALALVAAARARGAAFGGIAELRLPEGEKPRFVHGPHFSISHTSSRVACIACAAAEVGIDIETAPAGAASALIRKLQRWTASEATLKAAGVGLRRMRGVQVDLASLESELEGRRYVLRELALAPDTLGHVASLQPVRPHIECVALDEAPFSASLEGVLGLSTQDAQ